MMADEFRSDKFSWEIRQGNALPELASLKDETVDLMLTDPPYNIGHSYGWYHDSMDWGDYFAWQVNIFREAGRLLKPGGSIFWINYPETAARLWCAIIEDVPELSKVQWLTWIYHVHSVGAPFRKATRSILWFAKGEPYVDQDATLGEYQNPNDLRIQAQILRGRRPIDYDWWLVEQVKSPSPEKTEHPCQVPILLLSRIVRLACPPRGTVVDPFSGSASTGVACIQEERDYIGIDIAAECYTMGQERLKKATRQKQHTLEI